jgi:hypothetical protein
LIAPLEVGLQRLDELCEAGVEVVALAEEDPLRVGEARRQGILVDLVMNHGDDQLVDPHGLFELAAALLGGKRFGSEHEDQGPAGDNRATHPLAPLRARKDVLDVDPNALAARAQGLAQPIDRKRGVLARVAQKRVIAVRLGGARKRPSVFVRLPHGSTGQALRRRETSGDGPHRPEDREFIERKSAGLWLPSGGGGIRTLDPPVRTSNGFRDRRIQPLCHPSEMAAIKASERPKPRKAASGLAIAA